LSSTPGIAGLIDDVAIDIADLEYGPAGAVYLHATSNATLKYGPAGAVYLDAADVTSLKYGQLVTLGNEIDGAVNAAPDDRGPFPHVQVASHSAVDHSTIYDDITIYVAMDNVTLVDMVVRPGFRTTTAMASIMHFDGPVDQSRTGADIAGSRSEAHG